MVNIDNKSQSQHRVSYQAPQLKQWGAVSDLTQTGSNGGAEDFLGGSVHNPNAGGPNAGGQANGGGPPPWAGGSGGRRS